MRANFGLILGAALVGLAAALAWRNRERLADLAEPWRERLAGWRDRLPWAPADAEWVAPPTLH